MIVFRNSLIHEEVLTRNFVCNLSKCKGACCIEGISGAPLEAGEIRMISVLLPDLLPFMKPESVQMAMEGGFFETDGDGDEVTRCHPDGACIFMIRDENGIAGCSIQKANMTLGWGFPKPVSCHLYPLRIIQTGNLFQISFHDWFICRNLCDESGIKTVHVTDFVAEALIRKFGQEWVDELKKMVSNFNSAAE